MEAYTCDWYAPEPLEAWDPPPSYCLPGSFPGRLWGQGEGEGHLIGASVPGLRKNCSLDEGYYLEGQGLSLSSHLAEHAVGWQELQHM